MTPSPTPSPALPPPGWLPPLATFAGEWNSFVRALYRVFEVDFKSGSLRFRGCPVWYDRRKETSDPCGFEEGFWHLITRDELVQNPKTRQKETQRLPDIERARRLPWGRPTIEHETAPETTVWDFDHETGRRPTVRTYLWLRDWDYAVVLERQQKSWGSIFLLITAFLADLPSKRRDLESRYNRRKNR